VYLVTLAVQVSTHNRKVEQVSDRHGSLRINPFQVDLFRTSGAEGARREKAMVTKTLMDQFVAFAGFQSAYFAARSSGRLHWLSRPRLARR
jgi:hypothetical protein